MKKTIAEKWVAALRSGKYKQTKAILKSPRGNFCCLGVLCDLYREEKATKRRNIYWKYGEPAQTLVILEKGVERELEETVLPKEVQKWAGMKSVDGGFSHEDERYVLAEMNDDGDSFKKIAKVIENNWSLL